MKHLLATLLAATLLLQSRAADLVVSNNAIVCWFSDSCSGDSSGDVPSTGFQAVDYVHSYLALNYPQYNLSFYNLYRSGGNNQEMLTNRIERLGLPLWGYQFNQYQHIGIVHAGDGGDFTSNQLYLIASNIFQAPALFHNGFALTNEGGWCTSNTVQWIGLGGFPEDTIDGSFVNQGTRNNAMTNAGWILGIRGIDSYNSLSNTFALDFASALNQLQFLLTGSKAGHLLCSGQLIWAIHIIQQLTTDTNISTCTVDWNTTAPVATNHCVISSISKSGNTLTFTRHDDRLPMAWDFQNGVNDCSPAFFLEPQDADLFKFTVQITNLPPGSYTVLIDGVLCASLPDTALAAGWNMFTNTVGPYWNQRKEVLGSIRDSEGADRTTLVGAGSGPLAADYGSATGNPWDMGNRGDALINALGSTVTSLQTLNAATHTSAQPTNHTFSITLAAPCFAPFHR